MSRNCFELFRTSLSVSLAIVHSSLVEISGIVAREGTDEKGAIEQDKGRINLEGRRGGSGRERRIAEVRYQLTDLLQVNCPVGGGADGLI